MSQCSPTILVDSPHLNISLCKCCKRVGLYYKNILVGFEIEEFNNFYQGVTSSEFFKNATRFPNGQDYTVLETCHPDIQFCFNLEEFGELVTVLEEAMLMLQVHESLEIKE